MTKDHTLYRVLKRVSMSVLPVMIYAILCRHRYVLTVGGMGWGRGWEIQTDRQTDRQTGRQTGRERDRQRDRDRDRDGDRQRE